MPAHVLTMFRITGHMRLAETMWRKGNHDGAKLQLWEAHRQLRDLLAIIAPMAPEET